jgi:hypothetical protein
MVVSTQELIAPPADVVSAEASNARLILLHAHEAAKALLKAFDASREKRRVGGGNTTDEEQDLLRAMLVFAGAGLDAAVKRLIEDALPRLARRDEAAHEAFAAFVARRIRDQAAESASMAKGYSLLTSALISESPQSALIQAYVNELIGTSLQSVERVAEALGALGLQKRVPLHSVALKKVFDARNSIVHEMDMDLSLPNRKRTSRRRDPMIEATNTLLDLGARIVLAGDDALDNAGGGR